MSGIDNAKKAMGWLHPNARAACGNCAKAQTDKTVPAYARAPLRCGPGGFITPRFARCDLHEPLFQTGSVPK